MRGGARRYKCLGGLSALLHTFLSFARHWATPQAGGLPTQPFDLVSCSQSLRFFSASTSMLCPRVERRLSPLSAGPSSLLSGEGLMSQA